MAGGLLKAYLDEVRLTRQHGVKETSFYPALKTLFDAVGGELKPKVTLILHPRSQGAGIPDGGLFLDTRARRAGLQDLFVDDNTLPDRGAIEVKPSTDDVDVVANSQQGQKYISKYGHLLVTNLRHFALYRRTEGGFEKIDELILADSDASFQALLRSAGATSEEQETALREFLTRACLTGVPLDKPEVVASFIASYAREALRRAEAAPDNEALNSVRKALQQALGITFDAADGRHFFLSTLVQTLFYGLFSGWVLWHEQNPNTKEKFRRGDAIDYLRVPMVDYLFQNLSGPNTLEPLGLKELLERAVDVLNRIERGPFFNAFDEGDAVQYFYEPFLAAFDPELRKELGVWYTPKEIVRYQVQRVDQILRNRLGLADGLADENVVVLDPCCGTGTYLVEVMALVEQRLTEQYGATLAPEKVKQAALRRIFGFELIPAPYVVAHLQLGLLLSRKNAALSSHERLPVFLTNALTGWDPKEDAKQSLDLYVLKQEREAALKVKREAPILVILGNPPYNGYAGITESEEERALTEFYRNVDGAPAAQGQGLNDLYVRFFRMAERRIIEGEPGQGVISFISNYSWLDSLSCPGMRKRFIDVFDEVWVDNLNGDKYSTGKKTPQGEPDPSAFSTPHNREGIQVGTAIGTLLRLPANLSKVAGSVASVHYKEFWGANKRTELLDSASDESQQAGYQELAPSADLGFPFKPREVTAEYLTWPTLPELMPTSYPGVKTSRDEFLVDIDRERLEQRIKDYFDENISDAELAVRHPSVMESGSGYNATETRKLLRRDGPHPAGIRKYHYRPFDVRWLYWDPRGNLLDRDRAEYVQDQRDGLLTLAIAKDNRRGFDPPAVSSSLASLHVIERGANHFLLRRASVGVFDADDSPATDPGLNVTDRTRLIFVALGMNEGGIVFFHALASMHSPLYRNLNLGALRQDWPRIPWPSSPETMPEDKDRLRQALERSAELGRRVAALLDSETPVPGVTTGSILPDLKSVAEYRRLDGESGGAVDKRIQARWGYRGQGGVVMPGSGVVSESGDTLIIHANEAYGWHGVPREVWEYKLGGYQVLKKWLSYREFEVLGRELTIDEILHVQQTARRIAALIALGPELDEAHRAVCDALS